MCSCRPVSIVLATRRYRYLCRLCLSVKLNSHTSNPNSTFDFSPINFISSSNWNTIASHYGASAAIHVFVGLSGMQSTFTSATYRHSDSRLANSSMLKAKYLIFFIHSFPCVRKHSIHGSIFLHGNNSHIIVAFITPFFPNVN